MERRINGRVYNTNTSKQVAKADRRHLEGEFWYVERLHRSRRGLFFLVGIGGELTRWNDDAGLVPLTQDQVDHWLEKHGLTLDGGDDGDK